MARRIVALCGQKRVGKDTVAAFLQASRGYRHLKFTQQLKDGLGRFFGFTPDQMEGPRKDEVDARWGVTPRSVMQWMGTEVMQHELQQLIPGVGRTFWAAQLAARIREDGGPVVISDMRFLHEYTCLKREFGADLVTVRLRRSLELGADAHASETECDSVPADYELLNDGTVDELLAAVGRFM